MPQAGYTPPMRRFVDLHTHSTASDGALHPAELIALAEHKKLAAVALTDHDTTSGLAEARDAAKAYPQLRFVAGIEVSAAFPTGTLHILGLGIEADSAALAHLASDLRAARDDRNPKIIARLQAMGLAIDMDDVAAQAGVWHGRPARASQGPLGPVRGSPGPHGQDAHATSPPQAHGAAPSERVLGRLHMAHAMLAKRLVRNVQEAFDRYIGRDAPAYIEKDKLPPAAVIAALHAGGALAVLAHPPQLNYTNTAQLERIVRELTEAGLDAIEAYHSDHTARQTRDYLALAQRLKLGVTGGSDFHGQTKPTVLL
ncbi:MAG: PHP domain-containing protein, partial [Phycisphaerae bacterium]|nr:PHP domain-containing protein [Phycisphaerae bacterium]